MTSMLESTAVTLRATEPFDFAQSLRFLRGFSPLAGEQDVDDGVLRQAVRACGVTAGVRLAAGAGGGLDGSVVSDGPLPDAARSAVLDRVRFQLGLDDDLAPFYALARDDPAFAAVVERLHGYHQVKFPSPLELLCWAILTQRTPMPVARRAKQALTAACGNETTVDGVTLHAFGDLEQLLAFGEDDLAGLVGNVRKARYLHGALHGWAELDEEFLRHGDEDAVRAALLALPGIGAWSASFLMIRGLGRTERIGPDKEMLAAASRVYRRPVDADELARLAARYGPWQGYWGHYLRAG